MPLHGRVRAWVPYVLDIGRDSSPSEEPNHVARVTRDPRVRDLPERQGHPTDVRRNVMTGFWTLWMGSSGFSPGTTDPIGIRWRFMRTQACA